MKIKYHKMSNTKLMDLCKIIGTILFMSVLNMSMQGLYFADPNLTLVYGEMLCTAQNVMSDQNMALQKVIG